MSRESLKRDMQAASDDPLWIFGTFDCRPVKGRPRTERSPKKLGWRSKLDSTGQESLDDSSFLPACGARLALDYLIDLGLASLLGAFGLLGWGLVLTIFRRESEKERNESPVKSCPGGSNISCGEIRGMLIHSRLRGKLGPLILVEAGRARH